MAGGLIITEQDGFFTMRQMTDELRATDANGLKLSDDAGNVGLFVKDGGNVGIRQAVADWPIHFKETNTDTSGIPYGVYIDCQVNPTSNSTAQYHGNRTTVEVPAGNTVDHTTILGLAPRVFHYGSGTITDARGCNMVVKNQSTGTITRAVSANYEITNEDASGTLDSARNIQVNIARNAGTITTGMGIFIDQVQATTGYGIYIDNLNADTNRPFWVVDTTGLCYIGCQFSIGTSAASSLKFRVYQAITDASVTYPIQAESYATYTASAAYYHKGQYILCNPKPQTGVTNSGYDIGLNVSMIMNDATAGLDGTIADMRGMWLQFGDNASPAGAAITSCKGLDLGPLSGGNATITSGYLIFANASLNAATNNYGIYLDTNCDHYITNRIMLNRAANTNMTEGIHVDQGANDNECMAWSSSDVAHSFTDDTATTTYGTIKKRAAATGGLAIRSYTESGNAYSMLIQGACATANTTRGSGGYGPVHLDGVLLSGNTIGAMSADGNIVSMGTNYGTKWLLDEDGDTWQDGGAMMQYVQAHDANGLALYDDAFNVGLWVHDAGGNVTVGGSTNYSVGFALDTGLGGIAQAPGYNTTQDAWGIKQAAGWTGGWARNALTVYDRNNGQMAAIGVLGSDTTLTHAYIASDVTAYNSPWMKWNATATYCSEIRALDSNGLYLRDDSGSGGIFIEDGGGQVGISTASPDVALHVAGNFRVEGTVPTIQIEETDGSADQNFQIRVNGGILLLQTNNDAFSSSSTKWQMSQAGHVAMAANPSATIMHYLNQAADDASYQGYYANVTPTHTATGTYYNIGGTFVCQSYHGAGVTNNGYQMGCAVNALYRGAGNIAAVYGTRYQVGGFTGGTGTITNCYGFYIQPFQTAGTTTNHYSLYITALSGGGTITTEWAIYSLHDAPSFLENTLYIGSVTDNSSYMDQGIIIQQQGFDTDAFSCHSSDVAHGLTSYGLTGTYLTIKKASATAGGALIRVMCENAAVQNPLQIQVMGGQGDTTKSTAGRGYAEIAVWDHDGDNTLDSIGGDQNLICFRNGTSSRWILDEDGDTWQNGFPTFDGDQIIITNSQTPATAGAAGTVGTVCWDSSYVYVCVAANTWKRAAIATW